MENPEKLTTPNMSGEKLYPVVVTACANGWNGWIPIEITKIPRDFRNVVTDMDIVPKSEIDAILHLGKQLCRQTAALKKRLAETDIDRIGDDGVILPKYNGKKGGR
ncbi:hypothetical protein WAI453_008145 [Rhynchosporium graminicola]